MNCNLIKVGGSLLGTRDLPQKLEYLIKTLEPSCTVIVVGGGKEVRELEKQTANSSPKKEHWDSLQIMTANAITLASHLKGSSIANGPFIKEIGIFFLDAHNFCEEDRKSNGEHFLPQNREVRSDSVALRFAQKHEFNILYLLKSVNFPESKNWEEACKQNYVDPFFHKLFNSKKLNPAILTINLKLFQITQPFNAGNKI